MLRGVFVMLCAIGAVSSHDAFISPSASHMGLRHALRRAPSSSLLKMTADESSTLPRRRMLSIALGSLVAPSLLASPSPSSAISLPFFESEEQKIERAVGEIADYRPYVLKILDKLKTGKLKGGTYDSGTVANFLGIYYRPMQEKMETLSAKIDLEDTTKTERLRLLPLLLKGHLAELREAVISQRPERQLEEVEEVGETLNEFLTLASAKYTIPPIPVPPDFNPEKDYYGIFGCEFWGKRRLPESNRCEK
ncbi:unnamed protein product [Vitrella brassicaformis CCMP3155]|uniref:Uncharacterized protein n=2 Tax=Vitrella brassicaformis TaxID=1169539 RepID=A0A0G4H1C3_VITBC|nr:unnamed protein product [Vitrella brassicaformis CCMP3155]|eukprot:CEM37397.1 unnamed protein product [Vitrella brassicaformis CCMP3155]